MNNDMTICVSEDCKEKENCARYTYTSDWKYQSYADFQKECNEENEYVLKEEQ